MDQRPHDRYGRQGRAASMALSLGAHATLLALCALLAVTPPVPAPEPAYSVGFADAAPLHLVSVRPPEPGPDLTREPPTAAADEVPAVPTLRVDPWADEVPSGPEDSPRPDALLTGWAPAFGFGARIAHPRRGRPASVAEPPLPRSSGPPRTAASDPAPGRPASVAPKPAPVRTPPRPLAGECPAPRYPRRSREVGEEGLVTIRVRVAADGSVETALVTVSSGFDRLDEAALDAIRAWRFQPAREGDRPVPGEIDVPVGFRLR